MNSKEKLVDEMTAQYGRNVKEYYGDKAPYVVLNRTMLEELPDNIQKRFISVIEEIENTFDLTGAPESFQVMPRGKNENSKGGTCYVKDVFREKCPPKWRK